MLLDPSDNLAIALITALTTIIIPAALIFLSQPYLQTLNSNSNSSNSNEDLITASLHPSSSPAPTLSLIIPAYNEQDRLPLMLNKTLSYFSSSTFPKTTTIELIIVSDGSTDNTCNVVTEYAAKHPTNNIQLIAFKTNRGKGAAIKAGMLHAKGAYALMVDADGATEISDIEKLMNEMKNLEKSFSSSISSGIIVLGSRAHLEKDSEAKRTLLRTFLMHSFHIFVSFICSSSVRDTQCGFKLFNARARREIFCSLHLERWAFDVEVILIAERLNFEVAEVGVQWQEVEGSKLDTSKLALVYHSLGMLRDMICVRLCYTVGLWHVSVPIPIPIGSDEKDEKES